MQVNTGALEFKNRKDFLASQIHFPAVTSGHVFHIPLPLYFWKNKHTAFLNDPHQALQVLL